jgi:wobble nucleotide-excising tRNase
MIKKIDKIHQIGKFENFEWGENIEFSKVNLLFGFNGSGKTTLSNIFNLISTKKIYSIVRKEELFKDLANSTDSIVHFTGKNKISYPAEKPNYENIYVFNSNFISEHVYDGSKSNLRKFDVSNTELQDSKIKGLNDNIEKIEKDNKKLDNEIEDLDKSFNKLKKDYNSEFRKTFSNKTLSIGKDVPTLKQFKTKNIDKLKSELEEKKQDLKFAKNQSKLNDDIAKLKEIGFKKLEIDQVSITNVLNNTVQKISTNSLTKNIENYQILVPEEDTRKVEPWYKFGYKLLKLEEKKKEPKCPLCDSDLNKSYQDLIKSFSAYFDKEYEKFISSIKEENEQLETVINSIYEAKSDYDRLLKIYIGYSNLISHSPTEISSDILAQELKSLKQSLDAKKGKLGKPVVVDLSLILESVSLYNIVIQELNNFSEHLVEQIQGRKVSPEKIELSVRSLYKDIIWNEFDKGNKTVETYQNKRSTKVRNEEGIRVLINEKADRLKNLKLEAQQVSQFLEKMGITHFNIDLNESKEQDNILITYKSNPHTKTRLKNTLSEGEKTALAFAYFLSKVTIETKQKEDTIIVIDDPISSLDDNRIYSTAFLIQEIFKDYHQVFILSHNFLFLKYLNPLFNKSKEKELYLLSANGLEKLPNSLGNFQTPYFYMIDNIKMFINSGSPDFEQGRKYLPNYIRRVLETYFSFKFAKVTKKGSQSPGLPEFIKEHIKYENIPDLQVGSIKKENLKEKLSHINNICDNFSHGNLQQLDNTNFISDAALRSVCEDCLDILEYFDGFHANKIEELISNEQ